MTDWSLWHKALQLNQTDSTGIAFHSFLMAVLRDCTLGWGVLLNDCFRTPHIAKSRRLRSLLEEGLKLASQNSAKFSQQKCCTFLTEWQGTHPKSIHSHHWGNSPSAKARHAIWGPCNKRQLRSLLQSWKRKVASFSHQKPRHQKPSLWLDAWFWRSLHCLLILLGIGHFLCWYDIMYQQLIFSSEEILQLSHTTWYNSSLSLPFPIFWPSKNQWTGVSGSWHMISGPNPDEHFWQYWGPPKA